MGAEPWAYFVPYQQDTAKAMAELQAREFKAGRYNEWAKQQNKTFRDIDDLREKCAEDGTRSILDMERVLDKPRSADDPAHVLKNFQSICEEEMKSGEIKSPEDMMKVLMERLGGQDIVSSNTYSAVAPLSREQLMTLYGTVTPSRSMVEENQDIYELLTRGQGVYVVVFTGKKPSEIYFVGLSYD